MVRRPKAAKVRAQDRNGAFFEMEGKDLLARAFCHETDHLNGVLFVTHASRMLSQEELLRMMQGDASAEDEDGAE